ncbi:MAG: M20/M25/M40 family metallo-hydrolase [Clostridia bacterium]|nr:M20/M25/M40 family metallo-hydrolase [Clostridia bacterium]
MNKMMKIQSIEEYAISHVDELLALVKNLCAIPSPTHHEEQRALFCKNWWDAMGAKNVYIDEAKNTVFPFCDKGRDVILFMAHTDTVFPDTQPMPYYEKDGKIFCPGIGDDTVNLAILLLASRYMQEQEKEPKYDIIFVANVCEEGLGNLKGCRTIMDKYGARVKEVISFDLGLDTVFTKAVGSARYKIKIRTAGGHSWNDFGERNAIHETALLIKKLYEQELPNKTAGKTTYNVGMISGGTSVNTIAQYAEFLYEYRSESSVCMEKMKENLTSVLDGFKDNEIQIEIEELGVRPGMGTCRDEVRQEQLIFRAEKIIKSVTGKQPKRLSGSTDCNIPFSYGIPSVCFGLAEMGGTHTREEYIEKESVGLGLQVALRFVSEYLI